MKLSAPQRRVLTMIARDDDYGCRPWPGQTCRHGWTPTRYRSIAALERKGLVRWTAKRMGGGIASSYWTLTDLGREVMS